jgi:hypothetical protein
MRVLSFFGGLICLILLILAIVFLFPFIFIGFALGIGAFLASALIGCIVGCFSNAFTPDNTRYVSVQQFTPPVLTTVNQQNFLTGPQAGAPNGQVKTVIITSNQTLNLDSILSQIHAK